MQPAGPTPSTWLATIATLAEPSFAVKSAPEPRPGACPTYKIEHSRQFSGRTCPPTRLRLANRVGLARACLTAGHDNEPALLRQA